MLEWRDTTRAHAIFAEPMHKPALLRGWHAGPAWLPGTCHYAVSRQYQWVGGWCLTCWCA